MNFPQKICSVALGLTLLVPSFAKTDENTLSTTKPENIETEKPDEVSFDFRAGFLYGCLEREKYDSQKNKQEQNMAIAAFCLCLLEGMSSIATVEDSQVVFLRTDAAAVSEQCVHKIKEEGRF